MLPPHDGRLDPLTLALNVLRRFSSDRLPHAGHVGRSLPRTSASNAWPQRLQSYSNNGIGLLPSAHLAATTVQTIICPRAQVATPVP